LNFNQLQPLIMDSPHPNKPAAPPSTRTRKRQSEAGGAQQPSPADAGRGKQPRGASYVSPVTMPVQAQPVQGMLTTPGAGTTAASQSVKHGKGGKPKISCPALLSKVAQRVFPSEVEEPAGLLNTQLKHYQKQSLSFMLHLERARAYAEQAAAAAEAAGVQASPLPTGF
jgi:hypothetical protein